MEKGTPFSLFIQQMTDSLKQTHGKNWLPSGVKKVGSIMCNIDLIALPQKSLKRPLNSRHRPVRFWCSIVCEICKMASTEHKEHSSIPNALKLTR